MASHTCSHDPIFALELALNSYFAHKKNEFFKIFKFNVFWKWETLYYYSVVFEPFDSSLKVSWGQQ